MPIFARWRRLNTLPAKRARDAMPGVYELANEDKEIIYIGQSAKDVPNRIRQHLQKKPCIAEQIHYWRWVYSRIPQAEEASQLESFKAQYGDLPLCNQAKPKLRNSQKRYQERSRSS